jgi:hypothetical protein
MSHPSRAVFKDGNDCGTCGESPAADVLIGGTVETLCRDHLTDALEDLNTDNSVPEAPIDQDGPLPGHIDYERDFDPYAYE